MANNVLTPSIVAKEALAILENNLKVWKTFHRGYEDEFSQKVNGYNVGDTVSIRRPADFIVRSGAVMNEQDVIEGKVDLMVDTQKGVDFKFTSAELTLKIEDLSERVIKPAMSSLINDITNDLLTTTYRGFYNYVGTPGQRVDSFVDFTKVPERMDEMAIPDDERNALFCPNDYWGFVGGQSGLFVSDIARDAVRSGDLGVIGGINTMMSQVVPAHTVGPLGGSPLVNGGTQGVTYDTVKNTWAQNLVTDGWTAAAAARLKAGDIFTIAGVFMVNPKTKVSTGILQQFVVNADVSSDGAGNLTASISPPIIASGPHQTVSAQPADNAAFTVLGTASTAYRQNLGYHKNAMAVVMVPLVKPDGAVNVGRESYKGMSVRVIPVYDGLNDINKWRLDVLYGKKLIDQRLGLRYAGTP